MAKRGAPTAARKRKRRTRKAADTRMRGPQLKAEQIDYKETATLQRLTSAQGKLFSRKRTGLDNQNQRRAALAVKRARYLALLPYVS